MCPADGFGAMSIPDGLCRHPALCIIAPRSTIRRDPAVGPGVCVGVRNIAAAADAVPERAGAEGAGDRLPANLAIDRHRRAVRQRAHDRIVGAGPGTHIQIDAAGAHRTAGFADTARPAIAAGVVLFGVVRDGVTVPDDLAHRTAVALFVVQVHADAGRGAGIAHGADPLALADRGAARHRARLQMRVQRFPAAAVADDDVVAITAGGGVRRCGHRAARRGHDDIAEVVGAVEVDGIERVVPAPGGTGPHLIARKRHLEIGRGLRRVGGRSQQEKHGPAKPGSGTDTHAIASIALSVRGYGPVVVVCP